VDAAVVAGVRDHLGLVQRHPVFDPVTKTSGDEIGVRSEGRDDLARRPAAPHLQRLRQIPVVERHERPDPRPEQLVDEALVEGEAALVDRAGPRGNDPRPADREAIRVEAELAHEADVLRPAVIVVAGDVAGLAGGDRAGAPAELIPDGRSLPVLVVRALDLVCRGRGTKKEARGKPAVELAHRAGSISSQTSPMRALIPPST